MPTTNGSASPFQTQEWEYPETHEWEGSPEWEATHEWESSPEWEATHEWESSPEWEATHEWESSPEWEATHEWESSPEWEGTHEGSMEWEGSTEADPFLPFLAPLAAKALPLIARAAVPYARRLLPVARRAIGAAVQSVLSPTVSPTAPPSGYRTVRQRPPGVAASSGRQTALRLVRRLYGLIQRGEAEAAHAEAAFFGNAELELEWEVAEHPAAHEAALTEVLAAEAAHTASEAEAEALLGAALPITIRIIAGPRALRRVTPALVYSNARLVRGLRRSGPGGPQLLRTVPTIQRRTLASLKAMHRSGRPIRPTMVAPLMAAHAAKVLGTPGICGPALVRNTVIRQRSVLPQATRYSA